MLDKEELIGDFAALSLGDEVLLESEGLGVGEKAEVADLARTGRRNRLPHNVRETNCNFRH
jgi:hypothetical protein